MEADNEQTHENLVVFAYALSRLVLNMHGQLQRGARCLNFA